MTIDEFLSEAKTVAIFGHVRPDGDCVGSTTAVYNYIRDNFPEIRADLFLENFPESYRIVRGATDARTAFTAECNGGQPYDLAFLMDTPSFERVGANGAECIRSAKKTINVDHHISNPLNLCTMNLVEPEASSACEVLYMNLDKAKVSRETANSLYLGIVHDTGAFKFSSTGKRTMQVVGDLIEKGIDFAKIVNETYYCRTYKQTLITGFAMQQCKLALNGKVVYSYITPEDMERFGVTPVELSTTIDTIREVGGTEVALLLYPVNGKYKISLRSNYIVDVNAIAKEFGGGGHTRAAGGDTSDAPEAAIEKILKLIEKQL
ncbi:MAG: bifunctional oligoribonuclease/PAP phosphatase NrnA [Fibrobacter sp.]|nr:bifunctional oligoribonuclease/PAP phosphatase NrnA [Fibrobacter sp.]MBR5692363.1 bifunctional oligoribonuclease/PAP phosphatase NrnA [Fibrobacter sp.]